MNDVIQAAFDLTGRVAVVTGAGSGIGAQAARTLADAGATVVLADLNGDTLEKLAAEIGNGAVGVVTDVTDHAAIARLADTAEAIGPIRVWVNSAGVIATRTYVADTNEADFNRIIEVNLKGTYWACAEAARRMTPHERGSIINISSFGGDLPIEGLATYSITKAGVNMLTRTLSKELGEHNVRVNAVAPGFIDTPMVSYQFKNDDGSINPEKRESYFARQADLAALKRTGEPLDIALAILYLAADASNFMTGQVLRPNGGTSMF